MSQKQTATLFILVAIVVASEAAMYGMGNIMHRRYPNGPKEYHRMPVPSWRPRSSFLPSESTIRADHDRNWMFDKEYLQGVKKPIVVRNF